MASGTVKRIVPERGFGFIEDHTGTEYFFHRTNVEAFDALRGGEAVTFEVEEGPKGKRAKNVRLGALPAVESAAPDAVGDAPEAQSAAPAAEADEPAAEIPAPVAEGEAPDPAEAPAVPHG